MDENSVITGTSRSSPERQSTARITPARAPASALYYIDIEKITQASDLADHAHEAARLGFDAVLLTAPFRTGREGGTPVVADYEVLAERLGGQDAATGLPELVSRLHRSGLAVLLDIGIDRIAADAPLLGEHPDWFIHAGDGPAFLYLAAGDAAVDWWDRRIAAWQAAGVDGFRIDGAHRAPEAVWSRLIGAAKIRDPACVFVASLFGAAPGEIARRAACGFDFAASSSCWWDGRATWLADDLDRVGAVAPVLTFAAPPGTAADAADPRAIVLAAFVGAAWVMPMGPAPDQAELIAGLNQLRARHRGAFAGPAELVSPPASPITAFARVGDRTTPGVALMFGDAGTAIAAGAARNWLADRCGGLRNADETDAAGTLTLDANGTLLLRTAPAKPVVIPSGARPRAKLAVAAPRIAIEAISPAVESGRFPAKRIAGEMVAVEADLITDGHGKLAADLLWRPADTADWTRVPMALVGNDRWTASFRLERVGRHVFAIEAWIDHFGAFVDEITKKHAAGVPIALELTEGTALVEATAARNGAANGLAAQLAAIEGAVPAARLDLLVDPALIALMREAETRHNMTRTDKPLPIDAERALAGFASWYEIFPRSASNDEHRHGNFDDVIAQLPRIRAMGFDVLYFPPIHPIGHKNRKGRNNTLTPSEADPGSPYAIGGAEGGHDAIHPELGGFDDFRRLIAAAAGHGLEIALDFAIQCAPDHPWLREHPEWFEWRPDGSIRYAENPPKKYEDIVNVDFYAADAMPALWVALRDVVAFWVDQGVRIFRVDNPHTKPFPFWEWMIGDIRARDPGVMFLAEAFTRPKLMYRLAKLGFSQSYTYFTWRNTADELREYLTELTTTAPREFFRPHFFVNTPDINPIYLQSSGRPGFLIRAALAATLAGLFGVYNGFELCEAAALPGREEYADSEKYQLRAWDYERSGNIVAEITALNRIRRLNRALHSHLGITFLPCSNDQVLFFEKADAERTNVLLIAISVDPFNTQTAEVELPLWRFGLDDDGALAAVDVVRDFAFTWNGKRQIVALNPGELPYCIWRVHA